MLKIFKSKLKGNLHQFKKELVSRKVRNFASMKSRKQQEDEKRINKEAIGKMADLVLDLIKMVFAGVVLAGIMDLALDKATMIWSASLFIIVMIVFWYFLFKLSKRKG